MSLRYMHKNMSVKNRNVIIASATFIILNSIQKKKKKPKRWWITKLYQSRNVYSGSNLLVDMKLHEHSGHFQNFVRMSSQDFEFLINAIGPKISKLDTKLRKCVPVQERLALTLRFLATGDSYTSMQYLFKISKQLISEIVPEVCKALIGALKEYVQMPSSAQEWLEVSKKYEELWNFPNCLGSVDGKHVMLQSPIHSGSEYYNYKSFFSLVLFALVDADYNFIYADVGSQGRISDGGVFKHSDLYKKLSKNHLNLPKESSLPEREIKIPYVFLGDEAFALSCNFMKPFSGTHIKGSPKRVFNYRLSRARRVVENVFGICSAVFRVLRKPMLLQSEKAKYVVMTIIYLHNFLRRNRESKNLYTPPGTLDDEVNGKLVEGSWRQENQDMTSLIPIRNVPRRAPLSAHQIRDEFTNYFITNGRLPWQDTYA